MKGRPARVLAALRMFHARQLEIFERQVLLSRPWEEDFLHWSYDGEQWQLHGHVPPPAGRRHSTTSTGWCAGNLRNR